MAKTAYALQNVNCRVGEGSKLFRTGQKLDGVSDDQITSLLQRGWASDFDPSEPPPEDEEPDPDGDDSNGSEGETGSGDPDGDQTSGDGSGDESSGDGTGDEMPEAANELIHWIGDNVDRAEAALEREDARSEKNKRASVIRHAEAVLNAATE